jgi:hypothetical protein
MLLQAISLTMDLLLATLSYSHDLECAGWDEHQGGYRFRHEFRPL